MATIIHNFRSIREDNPKILGWVFVFIALFLGLGVGYLATNIDSIVILLALVAAVPATYIFLVRTEVALYFHVFMTYTFLSGIAMSHYGAPSIAKFFVPYLLGVAVLRWYVWHEQPINGWIRVITLFLIYLFVPVLSILYASDTNAVTNSLDNLTKDMMLGLAVVIFMRTMVNLRVSIWILIVSTLFIGIVNTHQGLTKNFANEYGGFAQPAGEGQVVDDISSQRVGGPIGASNEFALSLVMILPLAVDRMLYERRLLLRGVAALSLVFIISTIMFTYSRGSLIAIAGVLAIMFFIKQYRYISVLLISGGIVFIILFAPEGYIDRMLTLTDLVTDEYAVYNEVSFRGRSSENRAAIDMFLDNIFAGVGVGNFNHNYQSYSEQYGLDSRRSERSAHSLYLEVASEQGLLGLMNLSLLLFFTFHSVFTATRIFKELDHPTFASLCTSIGLGLVGYLIGSIFIHDSYPRYFWLMIGLALSLRGVAEYQYRQSIHQQFVVQYLRSLK